MNYDFNDKEFNLFVDIQKRVEEFAQGKNLDEAGIEQINTHLRQAMALLAETPYLRLGIEPVEGLNGLLTLMAAMEVMASVSPSLCLSIEAGTRLFGRIINAWGNDAQKQKWLPAIFDGKLLGSVALSEHTLNVENDPLATEGEMSEATVTINGRKQFVINAPIADWIAVAGMLDGGPAFFIVEKRTPGLTIEERIDTLGYNGAAISAIRLENCVIPADRVVRPKEAAQPLAELRTWENQGLIGTSLGLMKTAFESAKAHAKDHKTGGKPIIAYQEIGFKLSEMLTLFQTAQLFAYRAAWTAGHDLKAAESLTLCAKVFCTESAEQVAGEALKILGGSGYIAGNPTEQAYRCAKYGQIAGTSTEIARVKIGDAALGMRL